MSEHEAPKHLDLFNHQPEAMSTTRIEHAVNLTEADRLAIAHEIDIMMKRSRVEMPPTETPADEAVCRMWLRMAIQGALRDAKNARTSDADVARAIKRTQDARRPGRPPKAS
jgi:hypothetical protein